MRARESGILSRTIGRKKESRKINGYLIWPLSGVTGKRPITRILRYRVNSRRKKKISRLSRRFNDEVIRLATGSINVGVVYGFPEDVPNQISHNRLYQWTGGVTLERIFRSDSDRKHYFELKFHSRLKDRSLRLTFPIDINIDTYQFAAPKPRPEDHPVSPNHAEIREYLAQYLPRDFRGLSSKHESFFRDLFGHTIPKICRTLPGGSSLTRPDTIPWREGGSKITKWNAERIRWDFRPGCCFHNLDLELGVVTVQLALGVRVKWFALPIRSLFPDFHNPDDDFSHLPATMIHNATGSPPVCQSCKKSYMQLAHYSNGVLYGPGKAGLSDLERCECPLCGNILTLPEQDRKNRQRQMQYESLEASPGRTTQ